MEYRSDAVGILYAEEFGLEDRPVVPDAHPAPAAAAAPPLTPADVEAACGAAVDAARLAWAQSDAARRAAALETLAAGITDLRADAVRHAEGVAEALAGAALGAVAALLPQLAAAHGTAEVRALLALLLPPLARAAPVVVRVHSSLIEALRGDVEALGEDLAAQVELRPANLPPGDARLDWPEGSVTRDAGAIRTAIIDGFAHLGLLPVMPPDPLPAITPAGAPIHERELEHAR